MPRANGQQPTAKSQTMLDPCKNCGLPVEGDFCPNCGQKVIRKRLTVQNLLQETVNVVTNIEKGFWYTTHMLFKNPGELARNFLSGATVRIFNPFRFLIIWMSVMVFLNLSLNILEKRLPPSTNGMPEALMSTLTK
ncbi:MAG: DUF3667 domain-containing protein [Saprospiraceae bacterium]